MAASSPVRRLKSFRIGSDIGLAFGVMALLVILVLPLPPFLLDCGLSISITASVLILMVGLFLVRPLDFTSFPTLLLISTLLRLSLNVATTRLVLSHGYEGPLAAGHVVAAFLRRLGEEDGRLDQAVRRLQRGERRNRLTTEEDLRDERRQRRGGRAADQVDRASDCGTSNLAPVAYLAGPDRRGLRRSEVRQRVGRIGVERKEVTRDRVEHEAGGITRKRVTRRVTDRHAARGHVLHTDLAAALGDLELNLARVELHVLRREQRDERSGASGATDRDHGSGRLGLRGGRHDDERGRGGQAGNGRHRNRYRRIDPPAGFVLRAGRGEADLWALFAVGRGGVRVFAGSSRTARTDGAGRRDPAGFDGRPRS